MEGETPTEGGRERESRRGGLGWGGGEIRVGWGGMRDRQIDRQTDRQTEGGGLYTALGADGILLIIPKFGEFNEFWSVY